MAMRMPHFVRLAEIDKQHFITACRHGLVHMTWGRITLRLSRDEFTELAGMLEQAVEAPGRRSIRSGDLSVTYRPDEECEFRAGPLALLLPPAEFEKFARLAQEAARHLEKILTSGAWDREEVEDEPPGDSLEVGRRNPFSHN